MQTLTFTYTKDSEAVSDRVLYVMSKPGNKYFGVDLTDLEPTQAAEFVMKAEELRLDYYEKLKDLQKEYDLTHNFRQFLSDKMSDIVEI